jgi:hypothetical protein
MTPNPQRTGSKVSRPAKINQSPNGRTKSNGQKEASREQIAESDDGRLFSLHLPICVSLPGVLMCELSDVQQLSFISEVVAIGAEQLRKTVVPKSPTLTGAVALAEAIMLSEKLDDCYFSAGASRTIEEAAAKLADLPPVYWIPGLARHGKTNLAEVLYLIGHALFNHRHLIESEIIEHETNDIGLLEWYEVLVVSEAITARAEGWHGKPEARLDQELRRKVMECQLRCYDAEWHGERRAA